MPIIPYLLQQIAQAAGENALEKLTGVKLPCGVWLLLISFLLLMIFVAVALPVKLVLLVLSLDTTSEQKIVGALMLIGGILTVIIYLKGRGKKQVVIQKSRDHSR